MQRFIRNSAITVGALVCLYWLLWLYDSALLDPRFFDGWVLAVGMAMQILFQLRRNFPKLPWGKTASWMQAHIYLGYFLAVIFALHTEFSLPDNFLEWAMWSLFVFVCVSGMIGTYLSWTVPVKLAQSPQQIIFERIPSFRSQLAMDVSALAANSLNTTGSRSISDLYVKKLHNFFRRPQNLFAHLRSSRRPLKRICRDIENLERYVDQSGKEMLHVMKNLVVAKDNLDFQYAHQGILKVWLFVHIPTAYSLILLSILHIAIIYAYSSGAP